MTPEPSPSPQARPETREIVELRQLRIASPQLAAAIDLQIAVLETQRLVQSRVPLPRIYGKDELLASRLRAGRRLIEFDEIAFDWSDARRLVRDAADLLKRFELVEDAEAVAMTALVRDASALPVLLRAWYDRPIADPATPLEGLAASPGAAQVCLVAMRPYLARCAAAVQASIEKLSTPAVACPVCAGEPDFTTWSARGRQLVCGRCTAHWPYPEERCAFCPEERPGARRSFASHSRTYRVEACNT